MAYDAEVDKQYSCSKWCVTVHPSKVEANHVKIISERSMKVESTLPFENYSYKKKNATTENHYVLYKSAIKSKTLLIYIHGGFWQVLDLKRSQFMADFMIPNNINYAAIGYNLSPEVSLDTIVREVRLAIICLMTRHVDMSRVFICGHSAGAHLALMSMVFDHFESSLSWPDTVKSRICGLVLLSGLYDVRPVCLTSNNDNLRLDNEQAWTLSPLRCISHISDSEAIKILIAVAQYDSTEFIKQSNNLYDALRSIGFGSDRVSYLLVDGKDHFDMCHDLGTQGYHLTDELLAFIQS